MLELSHCTTLCPICSCYVHYMQDTKCSTCWMFSDFISFTCTSSVVARVLVDLLIGYIHHSSMYDFDTHSFCWPALSFFIKYYAIHMSSFHLGMGIAGSEPCHQDCIILHWFSTFKYCSPLNQCNLQCCWFLGRLSDYNAVSFFSADHKSNYIQWMEKKSYFLTQRDMETLHLTSWIG